MYLLRLTWKLPSKARCCLKDKGNYRSDRKTRKKTLTVTGSPWGKEKLLEIERESTR